MLNIISTKISDYLINKKIISLDREEVYIYGLMLLLSTIFSSLTVLIISMLLADLLCGVLFLFVMMGLRFFCGGYHCKTYFTCWLCTNFIATVSFVFVKIICVYKFNIIVLVCIISMCSAITILFLSPIENNNNPLSDKKRRKNKKISQVFTLIILFMIMLSAILFENVINIKYILSVTNALFAVAILMVTEIIIRRCNNEHSKNGS